VQDIATRAEAKINRPGSVPGTKKHTYAKKVLIRHQRMFGDRGLHAEISVIEGNEMRYGTKGSVRLDVLEGEVRTPIAIYDYKFGNSKLTESRRAQIRRISGYSADIPIIEVKPPGK